MEDTFEFICEPLGDNLGCTVELIDGTPEDGGQANITIISPLHYNGTESVEVTVFDGAVGRGDDSQIIEITVSPINDPPTVDDMPNVVTNEDTSVDIILLGDDVDGDALTYTITAQPANGDVFNNGDGTVTYEPDPEYNGKDSFTYRASDSLLSSGDATVTITINPGNDSPVFDEKYPDFSFDEDTDYVLSIAASDVDGDALTFFCDSSQNIFCSDIVETKLGADITLTSTLNYNGTEVITIRVSDDGRGEDLQDISVTIDPVNDEPTVEDIKVSTDEDTSVDITFLGDDVDEGDVLTYIIMTQPSNGDVVNNGDGTVTYDPDLEYNGQDTFTYIANDTVLD